MHGTNMKSLELEGNHSSALTTLGADRSSGVISKKEERKEVVEKVNAVPRSVVDDLIDALEARINAQMEGPHDKINLDRLQQDAQLLFMLLARKMSKTNRLVEEHVQFDLIVRADKIREQHNSVKQLVLTAFACGLYATGGVMQMAPLFSTMGALSNAAAVKDLMKMGAGVGQIGSGVNSAKDVLNSRQQGVIGYEQTIQQLQQSKLSELNSDGGRESQMQQTMRDLAQRVEDTRAQTMRDFMNTAAAA